MAGGDLHGLAADLSNAGPRVRAQASQVVRRSALAVEANAAANAPVDTGFLRSSIHLRSRGSETLSVAITPSASYAIFQEHGTIYITPNPFMMNALEAVEPSFVAAMEQVGGDIF